MLRSAPPASDEAASSAVGAAKPARRLRPAPWTDRRLLLGVLLVVGSVVGVVWVVAASDDTVGVWAATGTLAPGMTVTADDVAVVRAQLSSTDPYLLAHADPVGDVVVRLVQPGELLPGTAVVGSDAAPQQRLVTVAVERHRLPDDLARGDRVDVYLVERDATGGAVGDPVLVLAEVTVDAVDGEGSRFGGSNLESGVALTVAPEDVADLVGAASRGSVVLVRVPGG